MPLSIDPVSTIYGAGGSLIGRILVFFVSGWIGILLGTISASIQSFSDLANFVDILSEHLELGAFQAVIMVLWPVGILIYLATSTVYGLLAGLIVMISALRLIFSEDAVLFWGLLITATMSIGPLIIDSTWHSWTVLCFFFVGICYGMWWAIQQFHPEWIDWVEDLFDRDED